ncbi:type II secretion system protein GspG [Myxococcota bacterium]|nr:type II secretion system protein GspG [Myxococcota bacterium]
MHLTPPAPSTRSASQRGGSRRGWGGVVSFLLALVVGGVGMWASAGSFRCSFPTEGTKLSMQQIDKALGLYVAINRRPYPSTAEGLAAAARYFSDAAPPKDAWGNEFIYLSNGERYELTAVLVQLEAISLAGRRLVGPASPRHERPCVGSPSPTRRRPSARSNLNLDEHRCISLGADGEPGGEDLDADIKSSELWRL